MPGPSPIRIAGAGPSGLAAAIVLARAGRAVEVHEAKRDVGMRFIGDLQVIEAASESEAVPDFLDRIGIERNFYFRPATWATFYDHRRVARTIRSTEPYGWFIRRGAEEATLDRGLLAQARALEELGTRGLLDLTVFYRLSRLKRRSGLAALVRGALAFWHHPALTAHTHAALLAFARAALADAGKESWKRKQYPVMTQNALRQLIAVSPELQTA